MMTSPPREWTLTPDHFEESRDLVIRILDGARRRGFTGWFTVTGMREVARDPHRGEEFRADAIRVRAAVAGEAGGYAGWQIRAAITALQNGGHRVLPAAGTSADVPGLAGLEGGVACEHCRTTRTRRVTYVLERPGTEQTRLIGRGCLTKVLSTVPVFISQADLIEQLRWETNVRWPTAFTVETVAAYAYAVTAVFGWVPGVHPRSTSSRTELAVARPGPRADQIRAAIAPHLSAGWDLAPELVASSAARGSHCELGVTTARLPSVVRALGPHLSKFAVSDQFRGA